MRCCAAFAAILLLTVGLSACGKYGPPVRTVVPQESGTGPPASEAEPQVPEEKIPGPVDFDDAQDDKELIP